MGRTRIMEFTSTVSPATIRHFRERSENLLVEGSSRKSFATGRGGRVAERAGFENRYIRKGIGGSNPPLSAFELR